jgi:thioredoxin reductase (NADPH)
MGKQDNKAHDLVIIGGGPAGLTAGLYASRAKMDVVLLEKATHGGQMLTTFHIENYPGFPDGIGGFELSDFMRKQAENFGLDILTRSVNGVEKKGDLFVLDTDDGPVTTRSVIVATGASPNKLGVPNEEKLTGRGVSYCATCDGALYRDRKVAVVGGGDSAVEEALFLTRFASDVHIIHRRDALRAIPLTRDRALENDRITMEWNTVVKKIGGDDEVTELLLEDVKTGETRTLKVNGVFIYVGITPQTDFLNDLVDKDDGGYIKTDLNMASSVPGMYAVGDVRSQSIRQVATAVGDGATAAYNIYKYLEDS